MAWAMEVSGTPPAARICDAGCGSGADIAALLAGAPEGHVTAVEKHPGFLAQARARLGHDERVTLLTGDMAELSGRYELIWSAGAVYFLGVRAALEAWRPALSETGAIAFSQIAWWTDSPSEKARAFWQTAYPEMTNRAGISDQIGAAGYEVLASRQVSKAAWQGFYTSLEARIRSLRPGADAALGAVLDEAEEEIALWQTCGEEYGYLLSVVRPA